MREIHGLREHKLYPVWLTMKQRCSNPKNVKYKNYGGRGISVCKDWQESFTSFYRWALANGYAEGLQIDREENDGNYEPDNCRFVTNSVNQRNSRNAKVCLDEAFLIRWKYASGKHSQSELGRIFNVSQNLISHIVLNKIWVEYGN